MLARAALLLTAALLLGAAFGVYQPGSHLTFWLSFAAGFLGAWGCCPLSQPLLERHKKMVGETPPSSPHPGVLAQQSGDRLE